MHEQHATYSLTWLNKYVQARGI